MVLNMSASTNSVGLKWNNSSLEGYVDTTKVGYLLRYKSFSVADSCTINANSDCSTVYNLTQLSGLSASNTILSIFCFTSLTDGRHLISFPIMQSSVGYVCRPINNFNQSVTISISAIVIYI